MVVKDKGFRVSRGVGRVEFRREEIVVGRMIATMDKGIEPSLYPALDIAIEDDARGRRIGSMKAVGQYRNFNIFIQERVQDGFGGFIEHHIGCIDGQGLLDGQAVLIE